MYLIPGKCSTFAKQKLGDLCPLKLSTKRYYFELGI